MMLIPRRNNFDLFDDFFDNDFFSKREKNMMRTDIREKDDKYIIDVDLPGFDKENINLSLNDGYLEISASINNNNEEKDDNEKYVRQERFFGECSRSFYVGDSIKEEDINASFKNGTLKIEIPKKEESKKLPESKHIEIK